MFKIWVQTMFVIFSEIHFPKKTTFLQTNGAFIAFLVLDFLRALSLFPFATLLTKVFLTKQEGR